MALISMLVSFMISFPQDNPAYLDLLKLIGGSLCWFGGLVGFMYVRQRKLKTAVIN